MLKTLYIHFFTEHLHGHHKNVATPLDAASANLGDNVYSFVLRSISHSYGSSYRIERDKFKRPFLLNLTVWSVIITFLLPALVWWKFGGKAMFFFSLNAFLQVFFLEVINFIEHYGLRRQQLKDGSYEPVNVTHSWNTPARITNYVLFKLQRHSDHHENSFKEYQVLESLPQSPHLPHGYSVCIFMALLPPLWDAVLGPYAKEYQETKHLPNY
jgi:alkane 1-monooxygenase